jgi:DNA-binding transcriptional regulator GbsR (MarR family)
LTESAIQSHVVHKNFADFIVISALQASIFKTLSEKRIINIPIFLNDLESHVKFFDEKIINLELISEGNRISKLKELTDFLEENERVLNNLSITTSNYKKVLNDLEETLISLNNSMCADEFYILGKSYFSNKILPYMNIENLKENYNLSIELKCDDNFNCISMVDLATDRNANDMNKKLAFSAIIGSLAGIIAELYVTGSPYGPYGWIASTVAAVIAVVVMSAWSLNDWSKLVYDRKAISEARENYFYNISTEKDLEKYFLSSCSDLKKIIGPILISIIDLLEDFKKSNDKNKLLEYIDQEKEKLTCNVKFFHNLTKANEIDISKIKTEEISGCIQKQIFYLIQNIIIGGFELENSLKSNYVDQLIENRKQINTIVTYEVNNIISRQFKEQKNNTFMYQLKFSSPSHKAFKEEFYKKAFSAIQYYNDNNYSNLRKTYNRLVILYNNHFRGNINNHAIIEDLKVRYFKIIESIKENLNELESKEKEEFYYELGVI